MDDINLRTVARCWVKSDILLTEAHEFLFIKHGKPCIREDALKKREEVDSLATVLQKLRQADTDGSDSQGHSG